MKTILIPTDLSTNSKAGIRFGIQLATQTPCKLVFYSVLELIAPTSWQKEEGIRFIQSEIEGAKKKLVQFLDKEIKNSPIPLLRYEYAVESGNKVSEMLVEYATKMQADFICMSTRGAGIFKKIIGTNASALVDMSPIPVFIVPKNYRYTRIQKIGYASDLENSEEELLQVISVAKLLNTPVELYHFGYSFNKETIVLRIEELKKKHPYIPVLTPGFRGEKTLLEKLRLTTKKEKTSLLVMFSKHKMNWLERLLFSGFTAGMTFSLNVPMLAYRKS